MTDRLARTSGRRSLPGGGGRWPLRGRGHHPAGPVAARPVAARHVRTPVTLREHLLAGRRYRDPDLRRAARVVGPPLGTAALVAVGSAALLTAVLSGTSHRPPPAPPTALGVLPGPNAVPLAGRPVTGTAPPPTGHGVPVDVPAHPAVALAPLPPAPGLQPLISPLGPSTPRWVAIPVLGVRSALVGLGLHADRTVEVPATVSQAGWFDLGSTPGAVGPAVLLGHVDSYTGPGVFYALGRLRPGDYVDVGRSDGTVARFQVSAVTVVPKSAFPTAAVYGPVSYAGLRLITCGGDFDTAAHSYRSNVVVYAALIATLPGAAAA